MQGRVTFHRSIRGASDATRRFLAVLQLVHAIGDTCSTTLADENPMSDQAAYLHDLERAA